MSTALAARPAPARDPRAGPVLALLPVLALVLAAVPVCLVAAAASGALDPALLADAGPVVRWAAPVVRVLHDVAAAAAVGLLLVAAFLTPEGRTTRRRETAARAAALAALVWASTAGSSVVLSFAGSAGLRPSAPGFWATLAANVWPLELTRLLLVETALVLSLAGVCWVARSRGALAWAFLLSLAALVPLSYTGHASGAEGHEQAMTALLLHLVGITVWVGGLLALVLLRPVLGSALPVTVRRFSPVALAAFVAVGASGVLFAVLQVRGLADLATPYGLLLLGKVAALTVLGVLGARQRRAVLADGVRRPGRFARLAVTELAVMGAAIGLAVALSRTSPPVPAEPVAGDVARELTGYPMPPPWETGAWLTVWRTDWLFLTVALVAVGLYAAGAARLHRRGDRWPVGRTLCWVLGWALFAYATNGAPGVYGRVMFSMHMVMHMALMMVVPIFLVVAAPVTLALRALPARRDRTLGPREVVLAVAHSRWAALVVNPVVAAMVFFGSLVAFYWTEAFAWALTSHVGHVVMVTHFVLAGYAFVWSLVGTDPGPPKWPAPLRLVVLLGTLAAHAFFGLSIMQGTWLLAPQVYKTLAVPWVPDLLADQQIGGTIAWGIGEAPTLVLAMLVTLHWVRSDAREAVRSDRRADRDHDAELAAYNTRLQELAARGTDRRPR